MDKTEERAHELLKYLWSGLYIHWDKMVTPLSISDEKEGSRWDTVSYFHTDSDNWDVVGGFIEERFPDCSKDDWEAIWESAYHIATIIEETYFPFGINSGGCRIDETKYWDVDNLHEWYLRTMELNRQVALMALELWE